MKRMVQLCFKTLGMSVAIAAGLAGPNSAQGSSPIAEIVCKTTSDLHETLRTRMSSARISSGIRSPEQILEVWADDRGSWTIVLTYATGTSCIVAMGEGWTNTAPTDPA
jgi:hypothetical protein